MYPLLLKAPLKDYLWGGTRLKDEFGFETDKRKPLKRGCFLAIKTATALYATVNFRDKPCRGY